MRQAEPAGFKRAAPAKAAPKSKVAKIDTTGMKSIASFFGKKYAARVSPGQRAECAAGASARCTTNVPTRHVVRCVSAGHRA
jgi:hypothetical protein